jgi:hypothetical protein
MAGGQIAAAASSPSWGALFIALVIVIVSHWLLPRVVFPSLARRRPRTALTDDPNPRRWAMTFLAGLVTYLAAGLIFGIARPALVIWGVAFVAATLILYARTAR